MKVKVAKWGNSLGVRLPKAAAEAIGAVDGADLELIVEGRSLKLVPQRKTSAQILEEMLDEIERRGLRPPPLVDWGPDVGSEIIDDDYSKGLIVPGPDGAPIRVDRASQKRTVEKRDARSRRR